MNETLVVAIRQIADDAIVHEVDCKTTNERTAEQIEIGANYNLNHDRYYTTIERRQRESVGA